MSVCATEGEAKCWASAEEWHRYNTEMSWEDWMEELDEAFDEEARISYGSYIQVGDG